MKRRLTFSAIVLAVPLASALLASPPDKEPLRLVATNSMPNVTRRIDHMDADVRGQRLFVAGLENGSLEVVGRRAGK